LIDRGVDAGSADAIRHLHNYNSRPSETARQTRYSSAGPNRPPRSVELQLVLVIA
jgi:hypothetical protein